MPRRKKLKNGTLRWRCDDCGAVETTTDDPVELAHTGAPMCCACDREMTPCATDLQPVLDALSRCACVLFKITAGDAQALGLATQVVQDSVKLLEAYGESDEWMGETPA
jgi:hypothetical protein